MARLTDHTKLESVKQSAMQLIVQKGYGGASISSIARNAKVAEGYLYRFFKSKEELVSCLLNNRLEDIINRVEGSLQESNSLKELVSFIVQGIFKIATNSITDIKFVYVMMNDYNFRVHADLQQRIIELLEEAKKRGDYLKQLDTDTGIEELFLFTVVYPIQFINLRLKNFLGTKGWKESDIKNVIRICNKTLNN
ncbi:MAG: hypothetical protein CSB06_00895 [Bacteroidia bacterium]|nr:MAG: hypothetical protein CSB06_00895 [Bacteroidia bacterium]